MSTRRHCLWTEGRRCLQTPHRSICLFGKTVSWRARTAHRARQSFSCGKATERADNLFAAKRHADAPELATIDVTQSTDNSDCKLKTVSQEELMNESHCTAAVLRGLIEKGILQTYRKEVGRLNNNYGEVQPNAIHPLNEAQAPPTTSCCCK